MRKRWRIVLSALGLFALSGAIYVFDLLPRARVRADRAGWTLIFTHSRLRCPTCSAEIEQFTFNGQPVPPVRFPPKSDYNSVTLYSPVGTLQCVAGVGYLANHGLVRVFEDDPNEIAPNELEQGYYEYLPEYRDGADHHPAITRKRGTPDNWCFGVGQTCRWVRPDMLDKLDW